MARRSGGAFVVRMEDLDRPRVVIGSAERILEDLEWLGCTSDEKPYIQSERLPIYERALDRLTTAGMTYPCDCSRAEIALVASAPHGEEVVYPGTCRDKDPNRAMRRPPALRFRAPLPEVDDFVLRRGDGVFAYQLAVSVDDLAMAISCVIRGADLVPSTPRQLAIMRALGAGEAELPTYVHLPLVVDATGVRIAKRTAGARIRALREAGIRADEVRGALTSAASGRAFVIPDAWTRAGV
jgi:glutamyl-tRNA synthetase